MNSQRVEEMIEAAKAYKAALRSQFLKRFMKPNGSHRCEMGCGRRISRNKKYCLGCSKEGNLRDQTEQIKKELGV